MRLREAKQLAQGKLATINCTARTQICIDWTHISKNVILSPPKPGSEIKIISIQKRYFAVGKEIFSKFKKKNQKKGAKKKYIGRKRKKKKEEKPEARVS